MDAALVAMTDVFGGTLRKWAGLCHSTSDPHSLWPPLIHSPIYTNWAFHRLVNERHIHSPCHPVFASLLCFFPLRHLQTFSAVNVPLQVAETARQPDVVHLRVVSTGGRVFDHEVTVLRHLSTPFHNANFALSYTAFLRGNSYAAIHMRPALRGHPPMAMSLLWRCPSYGNFPRGDLTWRYSSHGGFLLRPLSSGGGRLGVHITWRCVTLTRVLRFPFFCCVTRKEKYWL